MGNRPIDYCEHLGHGCDSLAKVQEFIGTQRQQIHDLEILNKVTVDTLTEERDRYKWQRNWILTCRTNINADLLDDEYKKHLEKGE